MNLKRPSLLISVMLLTYVCLYAFTIVPQYVQFQVISQTQPNQNPEDQDPEGIRKPCKYIYGTIDIEKGIQIPGLDKSQVTSYEIHTDNEFIEVWHDESEFIMQLSKLEGLYEIRIKLPNYYLSAYIDLPFNTINIPHNK